MAAQFVGLKYNLFDNLLQGPYFLNQSHSLPARDNAGIHVSVPVHFLNPLSGSRMNNVLYSGLLPFQLRNFL